MTSLQSDALARLAILRREDHFRTWQSLNDQRVCVLCDKIFAGHEVVIARKGDSYELNCPTPDCLSQVHQWVQPGNSLINDRAYADWWEALGDPVGKRAEAV